MRAYVTSLQVPKRGSSAAECEDAVRASPEVEYDQEVIDTDILAALADGASESLLARHWSHLLTQEVVAAVEKNPLVLRTVAGFAEVAVQTTDEWDQWMVRYATTRNDAGRPVQWYEEPGLAAGAHATVLAVHVDLRHEAVGRHAAYSDCRWYAAAIGDSCLFHIRDGELLRAFPVEDANEFDSSPPLLGTGNKDGALIGRHVVLTNGTCQSGDDLFLATDALAAWCLAAHERGESPWEQLKDQGAGADQSAFAAWTEQQRALGQMRNDDVTFLHIDLA